MQTATPADEQFTYLAADGRVKSVPLVRYGPDVVPVGWLKDCTLTIRFLDFVLMTQIRNDGELIVDRCLKIAKRFCRIRKKETR
jgi:hypothetical protein